MTEPKNGQLCYHSHEICRIRASILPIISGVLFLVAAFSLISSAGNPELIKILTVGSQEPTLNDIANDFHKNVYKPFLVLFIVHLARIYLSMLVIDEDPEFYFYNLKPLGRWGRFGEYLLRSLVLVSLLLLVKDHASIADKLTWVPYLSNTYFVAAIYIYASLLFWDFFMLLSLGIKIANKPFSRVAYFASDILGMAMAIVIVAVECGKIKISSLPSLSGMMYVLFFLSGSCLVLDLIWGPKNWFMNTKKYISHFFMFRHYFGFPCTKIKALSCPCPVETKKTSVDTEGN